LRYIYDAGGVPKLQDSRTVIEMSITRCWFVINTYEIRKCPCKCLKLIGKAQLHCAGISRNADDWAVVLISALHGASAAAYAGKTRLRM